MKKYMITSVALAFAACSAPATETDMVAETVLEPTELAAVLMDKNEGCLSGPIEQFGRYIGDWNIQDWQLSQEDGKTWTDGQGARWNFTCVGDGIAVQDFWMPNRGGFGTNLRVYNAETESWDIVWTATNAPATTQINAKQQENGDILMHILSPVPDPLRRIIFHPPTKEGWDWEMQMLFGQPESWQTVYKIKATPRP